MLYSSDRQTHSMASAAVPFVRFGFFFSKELKTEIFLSGEINGFFFARKSAIKFHTVILHYRTICSSVDYFNARLHYFILVHTVRNNVPFTHCLYLTATFTCYYAD